MATKQKTSAKRAASGAAKVAANNGRRRLRFNKPAEPDPQKRVEAVERAATRIKTTARIDTISPGQEY